MGYFEIMLTLLKLAAVAAGFVTAFASLGLAFIYNNAAEYVQTKYGVAPYYIGWITPIVIILFATTLAIWIPFVIF